MCAEEKLNQFSEECVLKREIDWEKRCKSNSISHKSQMFSQENEKLKKKDE